MTYEEKRRIIQSELVTDHSLALDVANYMNSKNKSYDDLQVTFIDELSESMDAYDIARAIIYGNVNSISAPVRFTGHGNLETVYKEQLEDEAVDYHLDELVNDIMDEAVDRSLLPETIIKALDTELVQYYEVELSDGDDGIYICIKATHEPTDLELIRFCMPDMDKFNMYLPPRLMRELDEEYAYDEYDMDRDDLPILE